MNSVIISVLISWILVQYILHIFSLTFNWITQRVSCNCPPICKYLHSNVFDGTIKTISKSSCRIYSVHGSWCTLIMDRNRTGMCKCCSDDNCYLCKCRDGFFDTCCCNLPIHLYHSSRMVYFRNEHQSISTFIWRHFYSTYGAIVLALLFTNDIMNRSMIGYQITTASVSSENILLVRAAAQAIDRSIENTTLCDF